MPESEDEAFVRRTLAVERHGGVLRKIPEGSTKSPDFELNSAGERIAVIEVKCLTSTPRTPENGWQVTSTGPGSSEATRNDNGPPRIASIIHEAWKQLAAHTVPKVLVFLNDEPMLDVLDLEEAFNGFLVYGNDEVGYIRNAVSMKLAQGRIRDEKTMIDLYVWIDRFKGGVPVPIDPSAPRRRCGEPMFRVTSGAGHELALRFFGGSGEGQA